MGLEIRVGYGDRLSLYSRSAVELDTARAAAMELRDIVNNRNVFALMFD